MSEDTPAVLITLEFRNQMEAAYFVEGLRNATLHIDVHNAAWSRGVSLRMYELGDIAQVVTKRDLQEFVAAQGLGTQSLASQSWTALVKELGIRPFNIHVLEVKQLLELAAAPNLRNRLLANKQGVPKSVEINLAFLDHLLRMNASKKPQ